MSKRKIILIIVSLFLIIGPFFINIYSFYKLISIILGIILLDVSFTINKKINIFLLFYLPILLLIFTYALDYIKTYTLDLSPIYIIENKINDNVSIYNSLFYRVIKCNDEYIFDNQYKKNFVCDSSLIKEININKLLNEPEESYKEYKKDFIKVTGKISKISGTSSFLMQAYTEVEGRLNGYVKFNETSSLKINTFGIDISNYRVYDYITIIGYLDEYNKKEQELILTNVKVEENNIYDRFDIQVIESSECNNNLKEYASDLYSYCIENVYLDYKVDKYELSYAIKDKKIIFDELKNMGELETIDNIKLYKLEKFNILECSNEKNILINKNGRLDYSLCEE